MIRSDLATRGVGGIPRRSSVNSAIRPGALAPVAVALVLAALAAGPAVATDYIITTNAAGNGAAGDCTLAEAIQAANSNGAVDACAAGDPEPTIDTIDLAGAGGAITITATLNLNSSIAIAGPATIDGEDGDNIFTVSSSGIVSLTGLTLTRGSGGGGPAIQNNDGWLAVTGCSFVDNNAGSNGGAILSTGPLAVTGSVFSGNAAPTDGGAIHQGGNDDAFITGTAFTSNAADFRGGAIYVGTGSAVTVTDCIFTTNNGADGASADLTDGGGAVYVASGGRLHTQYSVFDANVSTEGRGGAIFVALNALPVTIEDCSFDANVTVTDGDPGGSEPRNGRGGAIYNQESLTVSRCTFNGNAAPLSDGGAIANHRQGTAIITNVSFFLNGAGISGGAVHNSDDEFPGGGQSTVELRNCTFDQNDANLHPTVTGVGGSIFNGETVALWNTIVAYGDPENCSGTMTSNGHNLETGADCGFTNTGDLQIADPQLEAPAYNGGPGGVTFLLPPFFFTQDMAAMAPPLGAGDPAVCAAAPVDGVDQVGTSRPQGGGPACDMGAFESANVPVELVSFTVE